MVHYSERPFTIWNTCVLKVHERLGKLVTVRSRPQAIKLVKPSELASVQQLIHKLAKVVDNRVNAFCFLSSLCPFSSEPPRQCLSATRHLTTAGAGLPYNMMGEVSWDPKRSRSRGSLSTEFRPLWS